MTILRSIVSLAVVLLPAAGPATASEADGSGANGYGVLVMAHGGSPEWNQAVLDAVEPLRRSRPVEVAFGMADACSLDRAIRDLEARGVRRVGVVRLFVSGESWYERTEQILGLEEGAPRADPEAACAAAEGDHGGDGAHSHAHSMAFFHVGASSSFALSTQGLADAPEMGSVLLERARSLSRAPREEDVLILAHGPGDDAQNARWLASLDARAAAVRRLPFHAVEVQTLREDWPAARAAAEQRVRDFVARAREEGRSAIVIPFRVHGFGPYAEVLDGLPFLADQRGLLPHVEVTRWLARQAEELRAGPFRAAVPSGGGS